MHLTKAAHYAIVHFYLNGHKIGAAVDRYDPLGLNSGPINLVAHELTQGEHELTFKIIGTNPKARKSYMVGIDRSS